MGKCQTDDQIYTIETILKCRIFQNVSDQRIGRIKILERTEDLVLQCKKSHIFFLILIVNFYKRKLSSGIHNKIVLKCNKIQLDLFWMGNHFYKDATKCLISWREAEFKQKFHIILMNFLKILIIQTSLSISNYRPSYTVTVPTQQCNWYLDGTHLVSLFFFLRKVDSEIHAARANR